MGHVHATTAAMPTSMNMDGMDMDAKGAHHHIMPKTPKSGDSRFIAGTVGEFGESKTIKQKDGPGYGDMKAAKTQNGNDRKQQNYGVTDANFEQTLGVIADPDTGQPMTYAQTMQSYSAAGAIQNLYPDVYQKLVDNQDAGNGTVLGGSLALLGITKSDGQGGRSLKGIDPAIGNEMQNRQLGTLGTVKDVAMNLRDFKGREWNRAHHDGSAWSSMTQLTSEPKNWGWDEAALFTGDSMTSWAGRVNGMNNQNGDVTGFAADELAGLKYLVLTEQATGRPNILESVLGSHAMTHLPEDQLTKPKINKLIGLPADYRPKTQDDFDMVAGRLRQWAVQPGVQVDQGEFNKFVKAGNKTAAGQALNASGLLNQVQFKPEKPKTANTGGGENNAAINAAQEPTGLGTNEVTPVAEQSTLDALGGGATAANDGLAGTSTPAPAPFGSLAPTPANATALNKQIMTLGGPTSSVAGAGSPTIDTRPALSKLGVGGPFQVLDDVTKQLQRKAFEQIIMATLDAWAKTQDNAMLNDVEEQAASVKGARLGSKYIKDAIAGSPDAVKSLKAEVAEALKDGKLSDAEKASLGDKLEKAGLDDLAAAVKDGKVDEKELATLDETIDGAVSAKTEKDLKKAMEDGKLSDEEIKSFDGRIGKGQLEKLKAAAEDGTLTKEELTGIADAAKTDAADAAKAEKGDKADKADAPGTDGKTPDADAATTDAKAGADAVGKDGKADPAAADKDAKDAKPAADTKDAKPAGDAAKTAKETAKA